MTTTSTPPAWTRAILGPGACRHWRRLLRQWRQCNSLGWETLPTVPTSTSPYTPRRIYECKAVASIGARGSGEDPQGDPEPDFGNDPSNVDTFGLGTRVNGMLNGFEAEYGQYGGYGADSNVKVLAVQYRALGTLSDPMRMVYAQDYIDSIYDGVEQTVEMVSAEADTARMRRSSSAVTPRVHWPSTSLSAGSRPTIQAPLPTSLLALARGPGQGRQRWRADLGKRPELVRGL